MTVGRDRWQSHLKSNGRFYLDWAERLEAIHQTQPENGAGIAALALRALAGLLEYCRVQRLTRNQHILLRMGEWMALAETAAVFSTRMSDFPTEAIELDVSTRQALARVYARRTALRVGMDGMSWAIGAAQSLSDSAETARENLSTTLNLPAIYRAQVGLIPDMDVIAEKLNSAFPA
jgi:hypothetical protein